MFAIPFLTSPSPQTTQGAQGTPQPATLPTNAPENPPATAPAMPSQHATTDGAVSDGKAQTQPVPADTRQSLTQGKSAESAQGADGQISLSNAGQTPVQSPPAFADVFKGLSPVHPPESDPDLAPEPALPPELTEGEPAHTPTQSEKAPPDIAPLPISMPQAVALPMPQPQTQPAPMPETATVTPNLPPQPPIHAAQAQPISPAHFQPAPIATQSTPSQMAPTQTLLSEPATAPSPQLPIAATSAAPSAMHIPIVAEDIPTAGPQQSIPVARGFASAQVDQAPATRPTAEPTPALQTATTAPAPTTAHTPAVPVAPPMTPTHQAPPLPNPPSPPVEVAPRPVPNRPSPQPMAQPATSPLAQDTLTAITTSPDPFQADTPFELSQPRSAPELASSAPTSRTEQPLPPDLTKQIATHLQFNSARQTELQLHPEELGKLRLTVHTTEAGVTLNIQADRTDTADLLRRHLPELTQDFLSLGFTDIAFSFGQNQNAPVDPDDTDPSEDPAIAASQAAPSAPSHMPIVTVSTLDLRL